MPESVKVPSAKPEAKVERVVAEDRKPEVRPHPGDLHAQLLFQQRTIGNQAVQRLIRSGSLHVPLKIKPQARRSVLERDEEQSNQPAQSQTFKPDLPISSLHADRPASQIHRATTLPGSGISPDAQKLPIQTNTNGGPLAIQRHWYNFDIPFTNYQFDPSWEGVKTAAGVVKDAAVSAFNWIVDKIKGLVSEAWDWLTDKWDELKGKVESAWKSLDFSLGAIVGFLLGPLGALANAIMSLDSQAVDKAWKVISGIVTTVSNGFKATIDGILAPVNALWGLIDKFASSTLSSISWLFGKLPGALQRIAQPFVDKLKNFWKSINDWWTEKFNKLKSWVDGAIDKVFGFVRKILSFGINVVVQGILQFGQIVLFIKDLIANPQRYFEILAQKGAEAFNGVETKFEGVVSKYFGGATKAEPSRASSTKVQRQPAAAAEPKTSASWGDIGHGVLEMMGKKWKEFKSNPLAIVKGLLKDLFFPILGDIDDIVNLFKDIKKIVTGPLSAGSLEELWTSILQILDIPILISKTVVSILMRSLMVPLIVATFVPHPLVKAIAAAVGESLLAAFISVELTDIEHKVLLLKTGATTQNQKGDAYNRVADSLIALAMAAIAAIIMLILHFIANLLKGIFNFIKGKVFPIEEKPVRVEPGSKGEPETPSQPKGAIKGLRESVKIGGKDHTLSVREVGDGFELWLCSVDCGPLLQKCDKLLAEVKDPEAIEEINAVKDRANLLKKRLETGKVTEEAGQKELDRLGRRLDRVAKKEPDATERVLEGNAEGGLTPAETNKLGTLADRANEKVADVIRSRGGTGSNVNEAGPWAQKTLGETARAAVAGDESAETAIKIAKQARRLGQEH